MARANAQVAVMGAGGVGKSAITIRFINGHYTEMYDPTSESRHLGFTRIPLLMQLFATSLFFSVAYLHPNHYHAYHPTNTPPPHETHLGSASSEPTLTLPSRLPPVASVSWLDHGTCVHHDRLSGYAVEDSCE